MSTDRLPAILEALSCDDALWDDFNALCDCGGRRAGSTSEASALQLMQQRLAAIAPAVRVVRVPYAAWRLNGAALTLRDGARLACNPLLGSESTPAEGITAEVCDLGRGTLEDFESRASDIRGRFALVRHEYPFSTSHIHRRRKLAWAMERGAAGFIIANPVAGAGAVVGSSGRGGQAGIPAVGTDCESAAQLAGASTRGDPVRLHVEAEDYSAETDALTLDLAGNGDGWVALSAHVDGHDLAESAMDNATGVAAALALARAFAPHASSCARGLRVCLFSAEEWALAGSKQYLDSMPAAERDAIAGDNQLTALTSEFPQLERDVRNTAGEHGIALGTYLPMMANSDHYNFARRGIPALRLVAGFDRPQSNIRYILTPGDTRDKVQRSELTDAARTAALLVWRGLTMSEEDAKRLRVLTSLR
jgi:aminopeptidase YwaD